MIKRKNIIKESIETEVLLIGLLRELERSEDEIKEVIDSQSDIKEIETVEDVVLVKRGELVAYQTIISSLLIASERYKLEEYEDKTASIFDMGASEGQL